MNGVGTNVPEAKAPDWKGRILKDAATNFSRVLAVASFLGFLFGVGVIAVGGYKLGRGILAGFEGIFTHESTPSRQDLMLCLESIEYILLAPVPFLLLSALTHYVIDWQFAGGLTEKTRIKILDCKLLLAGVFIGVLTADFLARIVHPPKDGLGDTLVVELAGISILVVFFVALELLLRFHKK